MKLTPTQLQYFRLRRSGLIEPFATPEDTAEKLLGVQAQMMAAANLSFWNRTKGCTLAKLEQARLEKRSLVRFWGQRNTVHLYRATDWPFFHTVFAEWRSILKRRLDKQGLTTDFMRIVRRIEKRLEDGSHLTYKDVKAKKLQQQTDKWVLSYIVFMKLVREGLVCHGEDQGTQSGFVHRKHWLPKLKWSPPEAEQAFPELALRYLAAYGPAEARDLAFWYGGTVTQARRWIEAAGDRCTTVHVGIADYFCRTEDLDELSAKPPPPSRWPVRLLFRFDPLLLATKDKSWLVDEQHYKKVWRPSAHVDAVLLVKGRIAGNWRYDRRGTKLTVALSPFARLSRTVLEAAEKQAAGIAGFLGMELASFEVGGKG